MNNYKEIRENLLREKKELLKYSLIFSGILLVIIIGALYRQYYDMAMVLTVGFLMHSQTIYKVIQKIRRMENKNRKG